MELQRYDSEPIVEVFPKSSILVHCCKIAMRCGDDAYVDPDWLGGTDLRDLALLLYPQQLHLGVQRQLSHLVKKEGSTIRSFNPPLLVRHSTSERATNISKELRCDQVLWDRATVDGYEGP